MKMFQKVGSVLRGVALGFLIAGLSACATGKNAQPNEPEKAQPPVQVAPQAPTLTPLSGAYSDIIVFDIDATPELQKDYWQQMKDCQSALVGSLMASRKYKRVDIGDKSKTYGGKTCLVKMKLNDIRITSGAARFWGGAFAGSSYMNMHLTFLDGATQRILREEDFNSANNSWAAAYTGGSSDQTLPSDVGKLVADYIVKVVPAI